jgi:hypothetical protein
MISPAHPLFFSQLATHFLSRKRVGLLKAFSIIGLEMPGVGRLILDASGADIAAVNISASNI